MNTLLATYKLLPVILNDLGYILLLVVTERLDEKLKEEYVSLLVDTERLDEKPKE